METDALVFTGMNYHFHVGCISKSWVVLSFCCDDALQTAGIQ